MAFFTKTAGKKKKKTTLKVICNHKRPQTTKVSLSKNKAGDITLPNFLISKHITKLQKSEQYGTGIKTDIQTNGTKWRA